jgi:integrase
MASKRPPATGQILERERGKRYLVRIFVGRDAEGRKRYDNYRVLGTRKEAEALLREKLAARDRGTYVRPTAETVAEYLRRWLATREWGAARTRDDYTAICEGILIPALGHLKLTALTQGDIRALYASLRARGLTRRLVYTHQVLRAALREAEADAANGLARNPIRGIKQPSTRQVEAPAADRPVRALSREEAQRFLAVARAHPLAALWYLALDTGMRPSEYLALRWADLSDDLTKVYVRRSVETVRVNGAPSRRVRPGLKTEQSRRVIPLNPPTSALLHAHRKGQVAARLRAGPDWQENDLVFCDGRGRLLDHANGVWRQFKALLQAAGIPPARYRLYDLRHTCATLLLQDGESLRTVADRLGHADPVLTLRTYAHALPEHQQAATERLGRLLFAAAG